MNEFFGILAVVTGTMAVAFVIVFICFRDMRSVVIIFAPIIFILVVFTIWLVRKASNI